MYIYMYETYSQMLNHEDPPLHSAIAEPLRTPMSLYNNWPRLPGDESCDVLLFARFRIYEYGRAFRYSGVWLLLRDFFGYGNFCSY